MRGPSPHVTLVTRPVDLARDLELALDGPLDLITASALLDLVSAEWLDRLIVEAAARRLPVYAALTYDGRVRIEPAEAFDAEILSGFNLHQRTDKGFGPALGPDAAARAVERLRAFRLQCRARPLGLGVRTRRPGHPGRALCRLGRRRGARTRPLSGTASTHGSPGGALIWRRADQACGSVTSISSPGRSARAER